MTCCSRSSLAITTSRELMTGGPSDTMSKASLSGFLGFGFFLRLDIGEPMNDDIVDRLGTALRVSTDGFIIGVLHDAVYEIKQLRAEIERLKKKPPPGGGDG